MRCLIVIVIMLFASVAYADSPEKAKTQCSHCSRVVVYQVQHQGKLGKCWSCKKLTRLPILHKIKNIICRGRT